MSSIKIMRRRRLFNDPLIPVTNAPVLRSSVPAVFDSRWDAIRSHLPSLPNIFVDPGRARKTASGEAFEVGERIQEFVAQNLPKLDISPAAIAGLASKLKMPLIAAVGVAAVAGLAYLVYKLYTNRASISETISTVMSDLKNIAPDLTRIPGWLDSIKKEVSDAFSGDAPSALKKLIKIKDAVLDHQKSINPSGVGAGINMFGQSAPRHRHRGAGLKSVMY